MCWAGWLGDEQVAQLRIFESVCRKHRYRVVTGTKPALNTNHVLGNQEFVVRFKDARQHVGRPFSESTEAALMCRAPLYIFHGS